jgi:hypothetical protein
VQRSISLFQGLEILHFVQDDKRKGFATILEKGDKKSGLTKK